MRKELEQNLKEIVNLCYCHEGEKVFKQHIWLVNQMCKDKELKEIMKVVNKEIKRIDKLFEDYYNQVEKVVNWC